MSKFLLSVTGQQLGCPLEFQRKPSESNPASAVWLQTPDLFTGIRSRSDIVRWPLF